MASWIIAAVLLGVTGSPAWALCAERGALVAQLAATYGEALVAQGLTSDGKIVEVLATTDGATWTMLMTRPDGVTCVMASGAFWQAVEHELPAAPEMDG